MKEQMWLFVCLILWWLFCATSTYCKIHGMSLATFGKSILQRLLNFVLPNSLDKITDKMIKTQHQNPPMWPRWRKIIYNAKRPIGEEIAQHYFECPTGCLKKQKFETNITPHYQVIHRMLSAIASEITEIAITKASYLYLRPNSQTQNSSRWDCYEVVVIAETSRVGTENKYEKNQTRLYKNPSEQPIVILRVSYQGNTSQHSHEDQPFSSFVNKINCWLSR